jgi:citrate synthase
MTRITVQCDFTQLYPNVDFCSGIIYEAMGFKPEMFTPLFAIPRTTGPPILCGQWKRRAASVRLL